MNELAKEQRSRLSNIEIAIRPAPTDIKSRFNLLSHNKQAHSSN